MLSSPLKISIMIIRLFSRRCKGVLMKKGDIVIIIIGLASAVVIYFGYQLSFDQTASRLLVLKSEGAVVTEIEIDATTQASYTVNNQYGSNTIFVDGGKVYISEATCRNQICVKDGPIENIGQSLICLPNRVTAEIMGKSNGEVDDISYWRFWGRLWYWWLIITIHSHII